MILISYLYWLTKLFFLKDKKRDVFIVLGVGSKNKLIRKRASSLLANKIGPVIQSVLSNINYTKYENNQRPN